MRDFRDMEADAKRIQKMSPADRAEYDRKLRQWQHSLAIIYDIQTERGRQVDVEGWTPEHDDEHADGQMADAAACYALSEQGRILYQNETGGPKHWPPRFWPWDMKWWKPKDRRRDLIRAVALIVAEIERLDRTAQ